MSARFARDERGASIGAAPEVHCFGPRGAMVRWHGLPPRHGMPRGRGGAGELPFGERLLAAGCIVDPRATVTTALMNLSPSIRPARERRLPRRTGARYALSAGPSKVEATTERNNPGRQRLAPFQGA